VTDYACVERVRCEFEIECVFHLAAQTIVGIANRSPLSTFETNVRGTWNVLESSRRQPTVQRVIVASSDKAYGDQERLRYEETAPLQGRHPYDVSKSAADLIAQ
jgi:CDP-glucose 4,6-dehydratase